ncbi:flagellar basal-body rod protein FlgG [Aeromonas aquatica]|uniref:flagellar basal-body rod protein FlgG n=1 Tax=Aeromonas aquatica TaxID=558964 RepID=UPI00286FA35B|nr:flagellar basal-body rod protein FlgG [Aeromonas aquatica]
MQGTLFVSQTGLTAQDAKMTTISNNLANVNTVAFKRDRAVFNDLFYQKQFQAGAQMDAENQRPNGLQIGTGVQVVGSQKLFAQGSALTTGVETDISIVGKGFLQIEMPDGSTAYSRDGQLHINSDGMLVNAAGLPLIPQITVPENAMGISIGTDGTVSATISGSADPEELGNITLAGFVNPGGLEAIGGNLFIETQGSGAPMEGVPGEDYFGSLKQGTLEGANVNVAQEMVDMIATQRAYEMNAKVMTAADEMLQTLNRTM